MTDHEDIELEDDDGLIWDDPREKPRTGATIIRKRCGRLDIEVFPPLLIQHAGMYKGDATMACAREGGILLDNIDIAAAEALAEALNANGEDCFVIPAEHVIELPREQPIHAARFSKGDMGPVDSAGKQHAAPWEKATVLAMSRVVGQKEQMRTARVHPLARRVGAAARFSMVMGAPIPVASGAGAPKESVKTSGAATFLDIVLLDPLRRFRVDSGEFDYSVLGDQQVMGGHANLLTLARWLLHAAPHVRTNFDTERLMTTGGVGLAKSSEHDFEDVIHWLINLARFEAQER